eukprot:TRINITY_DN1079_c0_g1_i4.p1 TRINITY_DN1079_c0_g1~~TRINITY_DN1079_c0_g1_i4.p1  ORF type:complete len:405 (-),score=50.92 TRINITY_DN1079_c0_g1_i4:179-1393(-)
MTMRPTKMSKLRTTPRADSPSLQGRPSASHFLVGLWFNIAKKLLASFRLNDPATVWDLSPHAKKDLWTFDQMIAVMAKNGFVNKAFKLYQSMKKAGVKPGAGTFMWLLMACARAPADTGGAYIPRCYYVLDEMTKFHVSPTIQHFNFILQTCSNFRDIARAEDVLTIMQQHKVTPDVNSYTSLLKASSASVSKLLHFWGRLKAEVAPDIRAYNTFLSTLKDSSNPMLCLRVYKEMKDTGMQPDKHTMSIILDVLVKEGQIQEAASVLDECIRSASVGIDTQLANKLISVASRLNSMDKLVKVLELMKLKSIPYDDATYEALIAAYGRLGAVDLSFRTYRVFKAERPKSLSIRTFTGLLLACRQSSRLDLLKAIEEDMRLSRVEPDGIFLKIRGELLHRLSESSQ